MDVKENEIQEKVKMQHKEVRKAIQDLKNDTSIFKKNQPELLELKKFTTGIWNTIGNLNNRLYQTEKRISEHKNQSFKSAHSDKLKKNELKREEPSSYINWSNLWLTGILKREEKVSNLENTFDNIIQKNFPKLARQMNI